MNDALVDWQTIVAAIQHWLAGGNPYSAWTHPNGDALPAGHFAYPPPMLVFGAPFALLPVYVSGVAMLLVSVIGFERWVRATTGRVGLPWLLVWLPFVQGLWLGQVTLLILVGLMCAESAYQRGRDGQAGVLLALTLLKPQSVVLVVGWLLVCAARERRWSTLRAFAVASLVLWGGALIVGGSDVYTVWFVGLRDYRATLPNRPLLALPFGPLLGILALVLWWRAGRNDPVGALLLVNTLAVPLLSVPYTATALAFVVIRWRRDWPWYPLPLSWFIPALVTIQRTPEMLAGLTQAIVSTGLLAGLLPTLPGWRAFVRRRYEPKKSI